MGCKTEKISGQYSIIVQKTKDSTMLLIFGLTNLRAPKISFILQ